MEAEILTTLQEIRGMLYIIVAGFGVLVALMVIGTATTIYTNIKDRLNLGFTETVKRLFEKKKYKDIIKLCEKDLEVYPRSAETIWWLARVYTELGNDLEALKLFRKVVELEPTWEAEYVSQYIKEINERVNNR